MTAVANLAFTVDLPSFLLGWVGCLAGVLVGAWSISTLRGRR